MGSSQSKVPASVHANMLSEFEAMRIKDMNIDSDSDFVYVAEKQPSRDAPRSTTISIATTKKWEQDLLEDPKNRLALSALASNNPQSVLTQRSATIDDIQNFNIKIDLEGAPITNQRASGRCWLFAATNVFRVGFMRKYNLREFELSQAYLFYWDKIEKANWFLEQVIDTVDEDLDGRLIQRILEDPVSDGGQWDMIANLVEKYGLVPHVLYPDSYNAMNSYVLSSLLTTKLREDALKLRRLSSSGAALKGVKEKMLKEVHLIVTLLLGPPPSPNQEITWEYYDKDEKFFSTKTTPLKFAAELSSKEMIKANGGSNAQELISLVNDPRNSYGQHLTVSRLGNIIGLRPIRYINVDMATVKTACVSMLRANNPIFFGCDVGKFANANLGILDTSLIDYELGFNIRLGLSKAQRLRMGESAMTHAMVLTAVHVIDGKCIRWRIQNSWGEGVGSRGWFVMTDRWMDEFVYQVVVDPRFISSEVRDILKKEPLILPRWDPLGSLA